MSTIKLSYETAPVPIIQHEQDDITEKRQAVTAPPLPSLLAQIIQHNESELAQAQERLQGLLLDWPDGVVWRAQLR